MPKKIHLKLSLKHVKAIFVICALLSAFFFLAPDTLAGNIYLQPGQIAPSQECLLSSAPTDCPASSTVCWNSQSAGVTTCGTPCDGGVAWTKYNLIGCRQSVPGACDNYWGPDSTPVYSTADKCSNGLDPPNPSEPYLKSGQCDGNIGGRYKTCCSNTTPSYLSLDSCVAIRPFSGAPYPPYDGVCPGGSHSVQCGFGSNPECGQPACGPGGTPKTCDPNRTYNECCGNNLSRSVTEYVWSDGTGVCNYDVGACNQTDPACAGATPPPAPTPTPTPTPDTQAPTF